MARRGELLLLGARGPDRLDDLGAKIDVAGKAEGAREAVGGRRRDGGGGGKLLDRHGGSVERLAEQKVRGAPLALREPAIGARDAPADGRVHDRDVGQARFHRLMKIYFRQIVNIGSIYSALR